MISEFLVILLSETEGEREREETNIPCSSNTYIQIY